MADFEATRLSLALRRRGMTQRELAEVCEVTSQYISNIENGREFPSLDLVIRMAEALRFPVDFFYGDTVELLSLEQISFRARHGTPSKVRDFGLGTADLASGVIGPDLENRFHLPSLDLPDLSRHSPETAAALMRNHWRLGNEPVQNVVHLLESRGVLVFWLHHDNQALDAASFWRNDRPYVLLNSLKLSGDRARFDAAHELGHLLLHREMSLFRTKEIEREADKFASAFLLPAPRFSEECPRTLDLVALYRLKPRWKVSVAAMLMRAMELSIYSDWQVRAAYKKLNARGELRQEKANFPRETSKLHRMVFDALSRQTILPDNYASQLRLEPADLVDLMPVAQEYMPVLETKAKTQYPNMRVLPGGKAGYRPQTLQ
jgi:Zn-dependent peptidase ImmA (M78 family)/DNA-binding XRE family transcriptional regulator